jgi:maltooligosyltrehalose trehalohydrolase
MHKFGVWAPSARKMSLQWRDQVLPMEGPNKRGWWTLAVEDAGCGDAYAFRLDDDPTPYPDPRSMRQTDGVHGLSRLYDHAAFEWHDQLWRGSPKTGAIIYELHLGTFSAEGTFDGAIPHLDYLAELGITHIELMPVAAFAGDRGWGYDGVSLFATHEPYGGPDGLKRFVDAAHARGMSVLLDVVYNHFGPVGNYTNKFGPYVTDRHKTPWGDAVNLDGRGSDEVRRFFVDNALMWLQDYHCDGLRFDAVHAFIDSSAVNFMEQISSEVERLSATLGREYYLIAESDLNDPRVVRPREAHGYGMDSQWSDDFHHALFSLLYTGDRGGYYDDFGTMADLHKALKHAYVYDGQYSKYRRRKHGRLAEGLSAHHFIHFDQNHDQVGNRAKGERLEHLCGLDAAKVCLGLVLCAPYVPMLFMGEEFAASSPFLYFADHDDEEMRRLVSEGRKREFADFGYGADEVPNPEDLSSFNDSKLRWDEVSEGSHAEMLAWAKALIQLRRGTVCLNDGSMQHLRISTDDARRTLVMQRDQVRVVVNLGEQPFDFELLNGEQLQLISREGIAPVGNRIVLPGMSIAILMSSLEEIEDREVG